MTRYAMLALSTLTLAACGTSPEADEQPAATSTPGLTVQAESLTIQIPVEGSVLALRRAEVSTRMMARITAIPVDLGSRVRRGDPLIRLGAEDIAANRAKAEAALAAAAAARDEAARHATRMDTLYAQDAVPRVQRDQAQLALTQATSQVALAEASLREVETAAQYATLRAPFPGTIVSRRVDEGDLAAPGMPLLVLEAAGPRDVVLAIPADVARHLDIGSPIDVTAADGSAARAQVRAIASGADAATRTVEVRARVPATWTTGIAVTALVPAGTRTAVVIPASAVVRRGQLTGVRVMTPDGELLRWIRLGRSVGADDVGAERRVEVLSGLEAGERIAL